MACENLTLGRLNGCKTVGGLKNLYFMNFVESLYGDITVDADEEITSLGLGAFNLYKYELRGANSIDEANENSDTNSFWTATGTFALKNQDAKTRKELKLASYGRPIIITEDYNGLYKIYGLQNGCNVSVGTASGSAMGDFNGYNLSITATEKEPAYFVDATVMANVLEVVIVVGT